LARWLAALALTAGALAAYAYWLFTGTHPACQVTMGASRIVTRTCGLPDVTDLAYVLAVVVILLLPEAKSIKIGSLEFERLTTEVRGQREEIARLSQSVSQVVRTSQVVNLALGGAPLAAEVAEGESSEGAQSAAEVADEFLEPDA
jgi:hypothetical protein